MTMTPDEAALALRDDPSFAAMTAEERNEEAALLLGTDDPLDVALAIEMALAAPAEPPAIMGPALEPCRLETSCQGREPLAGNGRCMTCGANRATPAEPEPPQRPVERVEPVQAPTPAPAPVSTSVAAPAATGEPLTARVKTALGMTDKELADMIGVSRPTAQAYVSGRLPEQIDGVRAEYLLRALTKRIGEIEGLRLELRQRTAV